MPVKSRFISQSLCKCDRCLSQENIRKARHFKCLGFFSNRSQIYIYIYIYIYIFLFLEPRDERKVWQRNLYCFPNSRTVTLTERDIVNMNTFGQSEHDTRIWYHGTAASKACLQPPE